MTDNITLIADAGSTKVDWVLIKSDGSILTRHRSPGLNMAISSTENIRHNLQEACNELTGFPRPQSTHYFGAGCSTTEICHRTASMIEEIWNCGQVEVASDMMGACRALLRNKPGVACILGTGSNSALYDGENIVDNTPPMGFILGDEGSGAALGKRLLSDIFKNVAPHYLIKEFLDTAGLTKDEVIRHVYRERDPNKFMASYSIFIKDHLEEDYIKDLVLDEFTRFLNRNVIRYEGVKDIPIAFIGSIASAFNEILSIALDNAGLMKGPVLSSPLEGLIEFYSKT